MQSKQQQRDEIDQIVWLKTLAESKNRDFKIQYGCVSDTAVCPSTVGFCVPETRKKRPAIARAAGAAAMVHLLAPATTTKRLQDLLTCYGVGKSKARQSAPPPAKKRDARTQPRSEPAGAHWSRREHGRQTKVGQHRRQTDVGQPMDTAAPSPPHAGEAADRKPRPPPAPRHLKDRRLYGRSSAPPHAMRAGAAVPGRCGGEVDRSNTPVFMESRTKPVMMTKMQAKAAMKKLWEGAAAAGEEERAVTPLYLAPSQPRAKPPPADPPRCETPIYLMPSKPPAPPPRSPAGPEADTGPEEQEEHRHAGRHSVAHEVPKCGERLRRQPKFNTAGVGTPGYAHPAADGGEVDTSAHPADTAGAHRFREYTEEELAGEAAALALADAAVLDNGWTADQAEARTFRYHAALAFDDSLYRHDVANRARRTMDGRAEMQSVRGMTLKWCDGHDPTKLVLDQTARGRTRRSDTPWLQVNLPPSSILPPLSSLSPTYRGCR